MDGSVERRYIATAMRDIDVRRALHDEVLADSHRDPNTRVIDELGLEWATVRVDVAVVNGVLHGYEIKSDADTLYRLPGQVEVYSRVLDRVTLVTGPRHLAHAEKLVPGWWELVVAEENAPREVCFRFYRRGRQNTTHDLDAVVKLLWRDEALALLERRGASGALLRKPRQYLYRALVDDMSGDDLRSAVRDALKTRTAWRARA